MAVTHTMKNRLQGLPPIVDATTRLLILGSFPGAASLQAQQYYAHPQNQFWKILQALWPAHPLPDPAHYAERCAWLLARGLGLWDVYASCERAGSLDSAIRHAEMNDFAALLRTCPQLQVIAHNGGESFRQAQRVHHQWQAPQKQETASLTVLRLPSTSPAHASWSFARKLDAWRAAVQAAGLL